MARFETPDLVPVLSRGKHRNPRKGACFMEFASYLAGERWSDHPSCTHPLLSQLARGVNDCLSDEARHRLIPLIPSVVGLTGDDPVLDLGIAVRSAAIAFPVVAHDRQRALAAGILAAQRIRDDFEAVTAEPIDTSELFGHARDALSAAPQAARWAERFIVDIELTPKNFQSRSAPSIVRTSVLGVAEACISDRDGLLYELLSTVITDCIRWMGEGTSRHEPGFADHRLPDGGCRDHSRPSLDDVVGTGRRQES